jgi:hypothetical protein
MLEPEITGYGFINKNTEILCIKTLGDGQRCLYLKPWRQAPPDEVVIFWSEGLENFLKLAPYIDNNNIDIKTLEPITISINRERTELWIG